MRKVLIVAVIVITILVCWKLLKAERYPYWQYSTHSTPDEYDVMISKVNTAVALQQIAEKGIKIIIIKEVIKE